MYRILFNANCTDVAVPLCMAMFQSKSFILGVGSGGEFVMVGGR